MIFRCPLLFSRCRATVREELMVILPQTPAVKMCSLGMFLSSYRISPLRSYAVSTPGIAGRPSQGSGVP
jgi:hypothetical protein